MKNWVEISERRLLANYRLLAVAAGSETAVLAVVKANAYGHGAGVCAPVLARVGVEWLGVTDAAEGLAVCEAVGGWRGDLGLWSCLGPFGRRPRPSFGMG